MELMEKLKELGQKMESQGTTLSTMLDNFKKEMKDSIVPDTVTGLLEQFKKDFAATGGKPFERKTEFGGEDKGILEYRTASGRFKITASKELNELARKFVNAQISKNAAEVKALSSEVLADGGALVPTELANFIIRKLEIPNHVMTLWTTLPMTSTGLEISGESAAVTVSWNGQNVALGESNPTFRAINMQLAQLGGLSKMSRRLVADSKFPLADWIAFVFGKAIREEMQNVVFNGSGSGQPEGLRFTASIGAFAQAGAAIAASDLINSRRLLAEQYRMNAGWFINSTIIGKIELLADTTGRFLYLDGLAPQAPGTLLGHPVYEIPQIPTTLDPGGNKSVIFFGDMSYYLWGDRGEFGMESSIEAGDAFEKHQMWMKVFGFYDGHLSLTDAFKKTTGVV